MDEQHAVLEAERQHLQTTIDVVRDKIGAAETAHKRERDALVSARQDMWDNIAHASDEFERLMDIGQHFQALAGDTLLSDAEGEGLQVLRRMLEKPYFARVDFLADCPRNAEGVRKVYIGRTLLMDQEFIIHVYDWRSPIASLFYRHGTGRAAYEAPDGEIAGELLLKRQYEIDRGQLLYYFDADVQITDAFLRKLLAQNTSPQMKAIVETIQKDQDAVIRDEANELLMVQGAAGSGKTSVALHRAAYLMYQGLEKRLNAGNILIVSPNALFEQYISGVLPDLGEKNVRTAVIEELCAAVLNLDVSRIQRRNVWLERLMTGEDATETALMAGDMRWKTSAAFARLLEKYAAVLPSVWAYEDIGYAGQIVATRQWMRNHVAQAKAGVPFSRRLKAMERRVWERVHALRGARRARLQRFAGKFPQHIFEVKAYARMLSIRESTALAGRLAQMTEPDAETLYIRLLRDLALRSRLLEGAEKPADLSAMCERSLAAITAGEIPYQDALAMAYLHLLLYGGGPYGDIRQVIVDEAQDYGALAYRLMGRLFPRARWTVLGDVNQTIGQRADDTLYEDIRREIDKPVSTLVTLTRSFRSTAEILAFAGAFLDQPAQEGFGRNGEAPAVHTADSLDAMDAMLLEEIDACQAMGYGSIALLCKTERDARTLHARVGTAGIRLIGLTDVRDIQGVMILPIALSKGLEFDAVLIIDADEASYHTPEDRQMLYVACTRALHRLNLFCVGKKSPFIPEGRHA